MSVNRETVQGHRDPFYLLAGNKFNNAVRAIVEALYNAVRSDRELRLMWVGSGWRTGSTDHLTGRAVDLMVSERVNRMPTPAEKRAGDRIANWLVANADTLGVQVIVWHGSSWTPPRRTWKPLKNRTGISDWHYDHVHVKFSGTGRYVPIQTLAPGLPPAGVAGRRVVSLAGLINAAKTDPPKRDQSTTNWAAVAPVEDALVAAGYLDRALADGHFGTATIKAYAAWQHSLGYRGRDADGIPGRASLEALGKRAGFEVLA